MTIGSGYLIFTRIPAGNNNNQKYRAKVGLINEIGIESRKMAGLT
jgi:hypothetical protein